ncbi:MAG TPA: helix-turn-helix domain-containing protein [Fredinandcohnia sp.]|nr:helix-turn-helix domain-containing protein [Fredinandcohnia sp.]
MNPKTKELSNRIATRVRSLRLERGWSQPELARRASLSNAMVSMVERGERTPSLDALASLAASLDVDTSVLLAPDESVVLRADARRFAEELSELKLPRSDIDALRRIARAFATEREVAARRQRSSSKK